jgi:hypothetical protein
MRYVPLVDRQVNGAQLKKTVKTYNRDEENDCLRKVDNILGFSNKCGRGIMKVNEISK